MIHQRLRRSWTVRTSFCFVTTIALMPTCRPADAQVNIEQFRSEKPISGAVGISGGGAAGNSDYFSTGATVRLALTDSTHSVLLLGNGLIGFAGGKRFSNDGLAHLRYTRVRHPRWQPEVFVQSDYNLQRHLKSRYLAGGGLRSTVVKRNRTALYVGNALMLERERLELPPTARHPVMTTTVRSSNYISLSLGEGDRWNLSMVGYYQPGVTDPADFRILTSAILSTKLFGPLAQTVMVRYRRDSEPPDGAKPNDLSVGFGIEWRSSD